MKRALVFSLKVLQMGEIKKGTLILQAPFELSPAEKGKYILLWLSQFERANKVGSIADQS